MKLNLTACQRSVLTFIKGYIEKEGLAPSYTEIAAHMGVESKSSVHRVVRGLEERGHIRRMPNRSRSITLIGNKGEADVPRGRSAEVIIQPKVSDAAFIALSKLISSTSGASPCQITITIREMPFAPTKEA